jgi:hypothetical protein
MRHLTKSWIVGFFIVALALGCSGGPVDPGPGSLDSFANLELQETWELYRLLLEEKNKTPTKLADVAQMAAAFPVGYDNIQQGNVVVNWGVAIGPDKTGVLAYLRDVPKQGGLVLQRNGKIVRMSAAEFSAANSPSP